MAQVAEPWLDAVPVDTTLGLEDALAVVLELLDLH